MRAFRVGYVITLSFLILVSLVTLTTGFYPAPKGPKAPEYPAYTSGYDTASTTAYQKKMDKYNADQKAYMASQKTFTQNQIVPYARNVFVFWIVMLIIFEVIGILAARMESGLVGGAFAFTGVWALLFGPIGCMIWFVSSLVSSMARGAEQQFSVEPILQAIGITTLIGVLVLAGLGMVMFGPLMGMRKAAAPRV